jgi:chemotaxis signal transduction protein
VRDDIICCTAGLEQYAFRNADVRYVARAEQMRREAGPHGQIGSLRISSQSVPVFDLGALLGHPTPARGAHVEGLHIIVTGDSGSLTGWLVGRVMRTPMDCGSPAVPLPATVGFPAARWFDALVKLKEYSVLLLAPRHLTPGVPPAGVTDSAEVFHEPRSAVDRQAEPIVAIFSTPVLPSSGPGRFAISGRLIEAVVQREIPMGVPGCAPHVTGVIWWRNAVVPVVDFRGRERSDSAVPRRCLIARLSNAAGHGLVAFEIDSEIAVHRPSARDLAVQDLPCPPGAFGTFSVNGEPVSLINLDALLPSPSEPEDKARNHAIPV